MGRGAHRGAVQAELPTPVLGEALVRVNGRSQECERREMAQGLGARKEFSLSCRVLKASEVSITSQLSGQGESILGKVYILF